MILSTGRSPRPEGRPAAGFTLIELLLVVMIALLIAGVAIPAFTRSFQGAQLKASVRAIASASRYARHMALLQQRPAALAFDLDAGAVWVELLPPPPAYAGDPFFDTPPPASKTEADADAETAEAEPAAGEKTEVQRKLPGKVKIVEWISGKDIAAFGGARRAVFHPGGMCDPFSVRLEDEQGHAASLEADPFTGTVQVEFLP